MNGDNKKKIGQAFSNLNHSHSKWAENDETWGGSTPATHNKVMLNDLLERFMNRTNSNEFEAKLMEDWLKK